VAFLFVLTAKQTKRLSISVLNFSCTHLTTKLLGTSGTGRVCAFFKLKIAIKKKEKNCDYT
jgi:hypothetical protein